MENVAPPPPKKKKNKMTWSFPLLGLHFLLQNYRVNLQNKMDLGLILKEVFQSEVSFQNFE